LRFRITADYNVGPAMALQALRYKRHKKIKSNYSAFLSVLVPFGKINRLKINIQEMHTKSQLKKRDSNYGVDIKIISLIKKYILKHRIRERKK